MPIFPIFRKENHHGTMEEILAHLVVLRQNKNQNQMFIRMLALHSDQNSCYEILLYGSQAKKSQQK